MDQFDDRVRVLEQGASNRVSKKTFNLPMALGHSHVKVASVERELDKKQAESRSMVLTTISGMAGVG